jgi:hypothetical protein
VCTVDAARLRRPLMSCVSRKRFMCASFGDCSSCVSSVECGVVLVAVAELREYIWKWPGL